MLLSKYTLNRDKCLIIDDVDLIANLAKGGVVCV